MNLPSSVGATFRDGHSTVASEVLCQPGGALLLSLTMWQMLLASDGASHVEVVTNCPLQCPQARILRQLNDLPER